MKNLFYLFLVLSFVSCTSEFHLTSLRFENTGEKKLPQLEYRINEEDLIQHFKLRYQYEYAYHDTLTGNDRYFKHLLHSTHSQDFKTLTTSFLTQKLTSKAPSYSGTAEFRVLSRVINPGDQTLTFLIPYTMLGIPFLFGVPTEKYKNEIEIEMNLYNASGIFITSYPAIGKGRSTKNIYNRNSPYRDANAMAIKDALEKIYLKIEKDRNYLNEIFTSNNN